MSQKPEVPKTFCALPWIHRFTNVGGEIQVCCTSEEADNDIRDNDGVKMSAMKPFSSDDVMNSDFMKDVRRQMLNGRWPKLCNRCSITEAAGGRSRRQAENINFESEIPSMLQSTSADGHIHDLKVRSFDLRTGSLCNLACRMCNPRSSVAWHREWVHVDQDTFVETAESIKRFRDNEWYKSPSIMEDFKKQLPHLRHMHFAGGEPLIVREMWKILQLCVESGHSKNIELSYNTNLTVIPKQLKELWPHFGGVKLLISVDAFGPLNNFIRYPSKWEVIDRNLRDIDAGFHSYGIKQAIIMCTVQVYNVLHLRPLYDYLAENLLNVSRLPQLIDLYNPNYYCTQILPPELKALAEARLREVHEVTQERIRNGDIRPAELDFAQCPLTALEFMKMQDHPDLIGNFLRAALSKDRLRNQKVFSLIPELKALQHHWHKRVGTVNPSVQEVQDDGI